MSEFTKEQLREIQEDDGQPLYYQLIAASHLAALERAENAEAERDRLKGEMDSVLYDAERVMSLLTEHGASILPHLMDDDENPGERLRQAVRRARERGGRG